jgi:glycosyltransferase involved in cell wall biosynthesis
MVNASYAPIVVDDFPAARRSLRIAVVTETYPPDVNGVAMTVGRVVEGMRARNHDIQLVRLRQEKNDLAADDERFREVLMRGLPIPRYPQLRMGVPSKQALIKLWSLRRPDLVHIATEGPLGWSALRAARQLKLPISSDFRTNFHSYSAHYGVGWLHKPILAYLRKFHNRTQCTMVPTEALKRDLAGRGFQDVTVVSRGVDTDLFDPRKRSAELRRSWGAAPDTPVVLCVGRLAPEKNLGTAIKAFEAMRAVNGAARLVLVGDGPAARELRGLCPDGIFAGMRTGEDLAAHYASADIFLFPSVTETFGNVTQEAMASGLAVLAYNYAAAAQLIRSGENGLLARFDDRAEFIHAATSLAHDLIASRAMGLRARQTACEQGWERVVADMETVFLSVLRKAPMPRDTLLLQGEPETL